MNSFIIFFIFLIIIFDIKLFITIIFGLLFANFGSKIFIKLREKIKIPKIVFSLIFIFFSGILIFLILFFLGEILFFQTSKIFSILTNEKFLIEKINNLQNLIDFFGEKVKIFKKNGSHIPKEIFEQIEIFFRSIPGIISGKLSQFSFQILKNSYIPGLKILNFVYLIILFLIFGFFMMNDWEKILVIKDKILGVYSEKALKYFQIFRSLVHKMLIGQLKVALILFSFYSIFFFFFKFEYYILFSLIFAILTLIPILGSLISFVILFSSFYILGLSFEYSLNLFFIFICGYLLENLYLTPRLVGSSLDVHPLIVLIGLILFAKFFGIFGVFLALPIISFLTKIFNNHFYKEEIQNFQ